MNTMIRRMRSWSTFSVLLLAVAVCNHSYADQSSAANGRNIDFGVRQHTFAPGEKFDYYYEDTESTYSVVQGGFGRVPRLTDLQDIVDVAVNVRVKIYSDSGKLMKKVELRNMRTRKVLPADIASGIGTIPFQPIQNQVPSFPDPFTVSYEVGKDAQQALNMNAIFGQFGNPAFGKLIDVFTFLIGPSRVLPSDAVGSVRVTPGVDVSLGGTIFHSATQTAMYNRVDWVNGLPQAYFKVQSPGNYFAAYGVETNIQTNYHIPLLGKAKGLFSKADLQEQIFVPSQNRAILRQVSFAMQTPLQTSAIDAGN